MLKKEPPPTKGTLAQRLRELPILGFKWFRSQGFELQERIEVCGIRALGFGSWA